MPNSRMMSIVETAIRSIRRFTTRRKPPQKGPGRLRVWLQLLVAFCLLANPALAAAQPLASAQVNPEGAFLAGSDAFLSQAAQGLAGGAQLFPLVQAILETPLENLNDTTLEQARQQALNLADQSALALGAVDEVIAGLEALGLDSPEPVGVAEAGQAGLPDDFVLTLSDELNLAPSQIELLDEAFQAKIEARLQISEQGLPEATIAQLTATGFTATEIEQLEHSLGVRGLADSTLASRREQFRAGQDELAAARTGALALYVQLLGKQITVRQAKGLTPSPITDDDLAELAEDELRLLIHVAHLQALWGDDPDLEVGEGDWWFIERYAGRAAERLEALILDSHNRGLAADLLVLLQIRSLALSARAGDPITVRAELDRLADLLAYRIGDEAFVAQQRQATRGMMKWVAEVVTLPSLRDKVTWRVAPEQRDLTVEALKEKLQAAALEDADPSNNQGELLFAVGFVISETQQLDVELMLEVLDLESPIDALTWALILLGVEEPTNLPQTYALILLSVVPVFDLINDLVTLFSSNDRLIKVLMTISVAASLGELFYFMPGGQGLGTAATVGDSFVAVSRGLYSATDLDFKQVVNGSEFAFEQVFDHTTGFFNVAGRYMVDEGITLGDDAIEVVEDVLSGSVRLWDDFTEYTTTLDEIGGIELVVELGFDEGSWLLARIFRENDELAEAFDVGSIRIVDEVGDEIYLTIGRLNDDASEGLGRLTIENGEEGIEGVFSALSCSLGFLAFNSQGSLPHQASLKEIPSDCPKAKLEFTLAELKNAGFIFSLEGKVGLAHVTNVAGEASALRLLELGDGIDEAFSTVGKTGEVNWTADSIEGLARVFESVTEEADILRTADYLIGYKPDVLEDTLTFIRQIDLEAEGHVFSRIEDLRDLFQWRASNNALDALDVEYISILRRTMDQAEYQDFKAVIVERWGEETLEDINRLAEAFAMETGIRRLLATGDYELVNVLTSRGAQGPDAILWNIRTRRWVIVEGKGTYTGAPLGANKFSESEVLGTQVSKQWIITNFDRYLRLIDDQTTRVRVRQMIADIESGEPYEVVIARGGTNRIGEALPLDIGNDLDEFLEAIRPTDSSGDGWTVMILFENLLGY